jgi:pimeloyl-ACP methyl ester carboxylesterase
MRSTRIPALLSNLALTAAAACAASAAPLQLTPCTPPGTTAEVRCGTYEVYEDRAAATGRKVPIAVVVLPATGPERRPDPFLYLAGGPGESATAAAAFIGRDFAELRRSRDIVLIDLRGTGQSAPLFCSEMKGARGVQNFLDDFLPVGAVRACRREHAGRALAHYNTAAAVDDVAEVLTALGYERANLFGASYGTRSALTLLRRHPERVRTVALLGVVPPDSRSPSSFVRDAQDALDGTLAECAADPVCGKAFPRGREELAAVLDRLAAAPVTVELRHPRTGEPLSLRLTRAGFAQALRYMLYAPASAALVPLYAHAAYEGNFRPVAELAVFLVSSMSGSELADGFFLSVTCAEDVLFIDEAAAAASARGTFIGDFRVRAQQAACREWDVPAQPRETLAPVRSDVPALLISGERDPVTPARDGDEVARHLSRARHVVVADGAHGFEGMKGADCLDGLVAQLVEKGSAEALDTACLAAVERPPFATELPAAEVAVAPERLAKLAGTYAEPEGGLEVTVAAADGRLRLAFGEEVFFLVAVSPERFRVEGMPAGYFVEFEEREGRVTALRLVEGANSTMVLQRRD